MQSDMLRLAGKTVERITNSSLLAKVTAK